MAYSIREALTGCRRCYGFIEFYFMPIPEAQRMHKPVAAGEACFRSANGAYRF